MKRFFLAASVVFVSACGADDESGLGAPAAYPVPGCEAFAHGPCDVSGAACRERLMELTACLRGTDPMPVPPVTLMTVADYVARANAEIAANPPPDPNHYERALALLDLVAPGELSPAMLRAEDVTVLGYYRSAEDDIVLVDHGEPDEGYAISASQVLVHEFVHALQDRDVDLAAAREEHVTSFDGYLGYASVVEGEARLHETRYEASLLGLDSSRIDWAERYASVVEYGEEYVLGGDAPYSDTWGFFGYSVGARYVHHAWSSSGAPGVHELLDSPPSGARAVLASVDELVVDDFTEPEFAAPEPPTPWALWGEETLGAWGLALALTRVSVTPTWRPSALDWRGDRLWIYANEATPAGTIVVWSIELASDTAANNVQAVLSRSGLEVVRNERRITAARSTGAAVDWALAP
jgi:hypothetical protein